jgi:hypothetical protein
MKWIKKGLIFSPNNQYDWIFTHAQLPITQHVRDDDFRVYFSGRDSRNRSLTGYLEININNPTEILNITEKPILGLGELGCFDDNGVSPLWIVDHKDTKYLYYLGWNIGTTVLASELTGLAISNDGGKSFKRLSRAPILERTDREPFSIIVATCVIIEDDKWRMWYDGADAWLARDSSRYNIKYAESDDGVNWERKGIVCIDANGDDGETNMSRACVLKEEGIYKMWFCIAYSSGGYKRIGYAESNDGTEWVRKDDIAGMELSDSGWDSEMVCYPHVFNHKGKKYMLYNGNGYGRTGIGLAIWED